MEQKISRRNFLKRAGLTALALSPWLGCVEPEKHLFQDVTGDGKKEMVYQIEFNEGYHRSFTGKNPVYFVLFQKNIGDGKYEEPKLLKTSKRQIESIQLSKKITYRGVKEKLGLFQKATSSEEFWQGQEYLESFKRRNLSDEQLMRYINLTQ